ncbi:sigma-54-dependent Fis family transcriptional regulator [candidate division KSB1 bacterium]|nr:sigma-54-dependent Fis family transcriptional regulator [candidate division KSB1 bacterium]
MGQLNSIFYDEAFIHTFLETVPVGILLLKADGTIVANNHWVDTFFHQTLGISTADHLTQILRCPSDKSGAIMCGHSTQCRQCHLFLPALSALHGDDVHRYKVDLDVPNENGSHTRQLLVSTTSVVRNDNRFVLMILEDITELSSYRHLTRQKDRKNGLLGNHPTIEELREQIAVLKDMDVPVLIQGESGTGKEVVARSIHVEGNRAGQPFIAVNCGAIPETLLESELFGHVSGAFSGAIKDRKGRFERAHRGTIFLDEIGDVSPAMQVKLLRVLQEGTFEPVGAEHTIKVDVRILSASNKDIKTELEAGRFREDLYYRLCVVPLYVPPLRKRVEDIPLLAYELLDNYINEKRLPPRQLAKDTIKVMQRHSWPGNVRELRNAIQYALVQCRGVYILPEHLPPTIFFHQLLTNPAPKRQRKRKIDHQAVQQALADVNGNKLEAARLLGVSRSTLYRFFDHVNEKLS